MEGNGQLKIKKVALNGTNLMVVRLIDANLVGANLEGANLEGVRGLTIEQLSKVKSLYGAKLDPVLMEQAKEKYPHLLEEPI